MGTIDELRALRRSGLTPAALRRPQRPGRTAVAPCTVGQRVAARLPYVAAYPRTGCKAGSYAQQMDRAGLARCREHVAALVDWIRAAAVALGEPFDAAEAHQIILEAIDAEARPCPP